MKFLIPDGPSAVGSVVARLVDGTRPAYAGGEPMGRALFVKVWYPAACAGTQPERLWDELRHDPRTPRPLRLVLALSRTRTSTHAGAALDTEAVLRSLVVYNHGLISFASENTSLMEHLASRGHVAVAIRHVEQLAELDALNRGRAAAERRSDAEWERRLRAASRDEKPVLAAQYYARSPRTNRIVVERSLDTSFVLDHIAEVLRRVPGLDGDGLADRPIHLVGFSVGGAVAHETAGRDPRAASVTNLDGGLYGTQPALPVARPYLMLYSAANEGSNDALLPPHAERCAFAGSDHLSYHDASLWLPWRRYRRSGGGARDLLERRNRTVAAFLERAGAGAPSAFPAVTAPGVRRGA